MVLQQKRRRENTRDLFSVDQAFRANCSWHVGHKVFNGLILKLGSLLEIYVIRRARVGIPVREQIYIEVGLAGA